MLIEVQQNVDLTYRLYDYGSDRELHLDDGVAVADPVPYVAPFQPYDLAPGRRLLLAQGAFVTERWSASSSGTLAAKADRPVWLIPLRGTATLDGGEIGPGGVWLADSDLAFAMEDGADLLIAYSGATPSEALLS